MYIQTQVSIAANSVNDNVIAGNQFEFAPMRAIVEFGLVAAATGLELNVLIGARSIVTRMLPSTANRLPIYPDDYTLRAGVMPGERIIIQARNTTGGAVVINVAVKYNPR